MKYKTMAIFGLIIGFAFFSIEGFLLRLIQMIEKTTGSWYGNILEYAKEPIIMISLIITICIIILSAIGIFYKKK